MSEHHGHKTLLDGTHVPLSADEAKALWQAAEDAKARRDAAMPRVQDALGAVLDAQQRLHDLGWREGGGLRVKRGEPVAVAEFGSTGIWTGWIEADGKHVHYADSMRDTRKTWMKPVADLTEDEREHLAKCDAMEREMAEAELKRFEAIDAALSNESKP